MKRLKIFLLVLGLIFLLLNFFNFTFLELKKSSFSQKISLNSQVLWVKICQTEKERQKGLSGLKKLEENQGMLFILPNKQIPYFWMKGMNFALDFIWLAEDQVVELTENVPSPSKNTLDSQLPLISPTVPVDKVLEVNAGWVKKNQIKIGDKIKMEN